MAIDTIIKINYQTQPKPRTIISSRFLTPEEKENLFDLSKEDREEMIQFIRDMNKWREESSRTRRYFSN